MGLLGAGGSVVTVPALILLLGLSATQATATSLVVVALISATGVLVHARADRVAWRVGGIFAVFGVPASVAGGYLSVLLSDRALTIVLVALLGGIGVWMWRRPEMRSADRPASWGRIASAGFGAGVLTGTLGVGGGFAIVPALSGLLGLPIGLAVGTSQLVLVVNALAGLLGRAGTGVVDVPLGLVFALGGGVGTLVASRLVERVRGAALARLFALMLVIVSVALTVDLVVAW